MFRYTHKTQQQAKIRDLYCNKHLVDSLYKVIILLLAK